jgi:hypothetical protein
MVSQGSAFWRFLAFGHGPQPMPAGPSRDARIDVIRGLALLVIFINHMPGNIVAAWMPHNFGFSDAADTFVLLAGVSATLAYGGMIEKRGFGFGLRRLFSRVWTLYLAHIAIFVIVCGIIAAAVTRTDNPLYIEAINVQPIFSNTLPALLDALTLRYQPNYLDILPLYIALLAVFPLAYLAVRVSPLLSLAASLLLWQTALALGLNLPNTGAATWFFNPFAWQVVFVLGVVIGRAAQLGVGVPRAYVVDLLAVAVVAVSLIVKVSSGNPFGIAALNDWIDTVQLGTDKTNLAWSRLGHVAALTWLAIRRLPGGGALLALPGSGLLAAMGRHSLEVFCVGVVLSILGQIVLAESAFDLTVQLLVCGFGVTLLTGLGNFLSWYRSATPLRAPERASAAASAPVSSA